MTACDVAVVGGGLVGASLACALAGSGFRVAVVEPVPPGDPQQPSYDDRTVALSLGTRRIFDGLGLWSEVAAQAASIRHIHVSDQGTFGAARLHAGDYGLDALGHVVANRVLGQVFSAALARSEGVELLCPARLTSLRTTPAGVTIRLAVGGGERTLSARLVIGADGQQSAVRRLAGITARTRDYDQTAIVANLTVARPRPGWAWERFTAGGPLAVLPMQGDRCSLVWVRRTQDAEKLLALDEPTFLEQLQCALGSRLGRLRRIGTRHGHRLSLVLARSSVAPRVALAGNAAHTLHPVAGQGFNLGVRDVAVLADLLGRASVEGGDPGDPALLRAYQDRRELDVRRMIAFTDGLVRFFSGVGRPPRPIRSLGLLVVDRMPALKKALVRQSTGMAGRLPRLARGVAS